MRNMRTAKGSKMRKLIIIRGFAISHFSQFACYTISTMKKLTLISWNVNGIRAVLKKGILDFIKTYDPDILCLQDTKAEQGQAIIDLPQNTEYWHSAKRKG